MKKSFYIASTAAMYALTPQATLHAEDSLETVVVTGIRSSLEQSAEIKRNANGVVDAISAEDIGKFPDTNLAESLQRITGVSIDRQSNEGNQITVRGLGPNFNMVTLNGRQMPAASSPEQESIASATQSRAFNFAEISSDSVRSVEVYKTSRSDVPSGGIGATVDIKTARPFDFNDTRFVGNVSGVHDASVEEGEDVTPDVAGLFSTVFGDGMFGFLANVSYSERSFSERSTHTDGWLRDEVGSDQYNAWCDTTYDSGTVDASGNPILVPTNNECNGAPFVYRPVTNISEIQHVERKRTNGQLVFQFAPSDAVTFTADYVMSRFERDQERFQTGLFGVPGGGSATTNTRLTANNTLLSATRNGAADSLIYSNELVVENDAFGLNMDWQLSDSLSVTMDLHSATSESQPGGELNDSLHILQGPLGINFDLAYSGSGVDIDVDDSGAFRGTCQFGNNDPNGVDASGNPIILLDPINNLPCTNTPGVDGFQDVDGFSPLGSVVRNISVENKVNQFQFEFDLALDDAELVGGISYIDYEVNTRAISSGFVFQNLLPCPDCPSFLTQVSIDAPSGFNVTTETDVDAIVAATFSTQVDEIVAANPPTFFGAAEESLALYANYTKELEVGDVPATLSVGLRYEDTNVSGTAFQTFPVSLSIVSETEGVVNFDGVAPSEFIDVREGYTAFLPSIDFQIRPTDETVVRGSYGRSIARPDLNALRPITTVSDYRPGQATSSTGNPGLKPYTSDNFDLSMEYYYNEGSYASLAGFHKRISDYIATETFVEPLLDTNGLPITNPEARFDITNLDPDGVPIVVTSEPTDPDAEFQVSRPSNSQERTVSGLELAVQHLFGDTGFGIQANYTVVDSNVDFNPNILEGQAILIGLSDSANLVGYYENDLVSIRLAGNWRDEFLFSENQLRASNEPVFTKEYVQFDLSAQVSVLDNLSVVFEVLNLTGEDQKYRGRYKDQFLFENDQDPRFTLGVRAEL